MFICNFKINQKKIVKIFIFIAAIIVLILLAVVISKVFNNIKSANSSKTTISDTIPSPDIAEISPENYTDILKEVHEDLDTYIGQRISFTRICLQSEWLKRRWIYFSKRSGYK